MCVLVYECVFTPSERSTVAGLLQPTTILTFNSGNTNVSSAALHPTVRLYARRWISGRAAVSRRVNRIDLMTFTAKGNKKSTPNWLVLSRSEGGISTWRPRSSPTSQQECLGTDEGFSSICNRIVLLKLNRRVSIPRSDSRGCQNQVACLRCPHVYSFVTRRQTFVVSFWHRGRERDQSWTRFISLIRSVLLS